jgi:peptide/nickel transport system substrate-binding protein
MRFCVALGAWSGAAALALAVFSGAASAQKSGGILKMPHGDSPASMSIHEESTIVAEGPMMAVFNNLVMFDQHTAQNRLDTIVPDLASEWSWSEDGAVLTFKLRQGVKWHDGSRSRPRTSNAPGTCCRERVRKSFGSTRANPGTKI